jgi:hypothetical protein
MKLLGATPTALLGALLIALTLLMLPTWAGGDPNSTTQKVNGGEDSSEDRLLDDSTSNEKDNIVVNEVMVSPMSVFLRC